MRNDAERWPRPRPPETGALPPGDLDGLIGWWEAANYLTAVQIYLKENPRSASRCSASTSSRGFSGTGAHRPRR